MTQWEQFLGVCWLVHEGWDAGEVGTEENGFEEGE